MDALEGWIPVPIQAGVVLALAALPLWLPPALMLAKPRKSSGRANVGFLLAVLSPVVAALTLKIGTDYCRRGGSSMRVGMFGGPFWPNCPRAELAWIAILALPTAMGLTAWAIAIHVRSRQQTSEASERPRNEMEEFP